MILWLIIPLALVVIYLVFTYNQFVTIKESRLKNALQAIGNQLKRQADLIPNLVEVVKSYMKHEQAVFDKITAARQNVASALNSQEAQKLIDASSQMQAALNPIRVVLESTPEIKAAGPSTKLMDELRDTADKITYARQTLVDLTADYNRLVATVPSNLVAKIFGFQSLAGLKTPETGEYLEVTTAETKTPSVKL